MFRWYVDQHLLGHENKVKANLEHRIDSMASSRGSAASSSRPSR